MPIARIHVLEGRYDERRLGNVSKAVQDSLISILTIPTDDFLHGVRSGFRFPQRAWGQIRFSVSATFTRR
jgi:hypothetical protein